MEALVRRAFGDDVLIERQGPRYATVSVSLTAIEHAHAQLPKGCKQGTRGSDRTQHVEQFHADAS